MLPKKRKIGIRLFPIISRTGKNISSEHFSFRFVKTPGMRESRFSFVVSGKVSKKATERNLLKRRGYAIIQNNDALKQISVAGVFFAKSGATKLSYNDLKQEINDLLTRAHII